MEGLGLSPENIQNLLCAGVWIVILIGGLIYHTARGVPDHASDDYHTFL